MIKSIERYKIRKKVRITETGKLIHAQVKCIDRKTIQKTNGLIKYDCPVKNYNDLVRRRQGSVSYFSGYVPLVLFLVLIPFEKKEWISKKRGKWEIESSIYWYYPDEISNYSENKESKRIEIPLKNELNLESFTFLFNLLIKNYGNEYS